MRYDDDVSNSERLPVLIGNKEYVVIFDSFDVSGLLCCKSDEVNDDS